MAQKKIGACLVCGEPLVYYESAREMTCVYCGRSFPSNRRLRGGPLRLRRLPQPEGGGEHPGLLRGPVRAGTPSPSLRP